MTLGPHLRPHRTIRDGESQGQKVKCKGWEVKGTEMPLLRNSQRGGERKGNKQCL